MSVLEDAAAGGVIERPSFLDFLVESGKFILLSFDPVASVAALQDERATQQAAEIQVPQAKFLAIVRTCKNDSVTWPFPPKEPPVGLGLLLVGLNPPAEPNSTAYIALFAPHVHPLDRPPMLVEPPLPWAELYVHTLKRTSARVTRVHTGNPSLTQLTSSQRLLLEKAASADSNTAGIQQPLEVALITIISATPDGAAAPAVSQGHISSVGPEDNSDSSSQAASEHLQTDNLDVLASTDSNTAGIQQPLEVALITVISATPDGAAAPSVSQGHISSSGPEDNSDSSSQAASEHLQTDNLDVLLGPRVETEDSDEESTSESSSSKKSDGAGTEPPIMRLHAEVWYDLSSAPEVADPASYYAIINRLHEIEDEWRERAAKEILADQPRTREWVQGVADATFVDPEEPETSALERASSPPLDAPLVTGAGPEETDTATDHAHAMDPAKTPAKPRHPLARLLSHVVELPRRFIAKLIAIFPLQRKPKANAASAPSPESAPAAEPVPAPVSTPASAPAPAPSSTSAPAPETSPTAP